MPSARPDGIHVVCAADEHFAVPLTVMMTSAALNTASRPLVFHVLAKRLGAGTRTRIRRAIEAKGGDVMFVPIAERDVLREATVSGHVSSVTYYRLLIDRSLPADLDRVIYIDADVVVQGDLWELWRLDTAGRAFLAVPEAGIGEHLRPILARLAPGSESATEFFNAGVMLVDLARWRALGVGERALGMIARREIPLWFWDQDVLNLAAVGAWGPLPERWNSMGHRPPVDPPGIVHFNAQVKPWHRASRHPARGLFFEYLHMTDWGWRGSLWMATDPAARKLRRGWHYAKRRILGRARQ